MTKFLLPVLQIVFLAQISKECLYKPKLPTAKELTLPGPWNDKLYTREFKYAAGRCECGQEFSPGQIPPWNIFIHVGRTICSGTIVTSNLVATSHECVRASNKPLNIYDAWNISSDYKAFKNVDDIKVTTTIDPKVGETFPILELIPNPQFLLSWKSKSEKLGYDSLDLLLIKVNADFTSHNDHRPICIPASANLDFVGRTGYYTIIEEGTPPGNISYETYTGEIFTRQMCKGREANIEVYLAFPKVRVKNDELSGFCFGYVNKVGSLRPIYLGGALFLETKDGSSFLAGIASNKVTSVGAWVDYVHFSNIIPMIKYLEHRAHQHQSTWCRAPRFNLEDKLPPINGHRWLWPWETESIQETLNVRNETLDCVCGVPNNRNVGFAIGTAYEFGWLVAINIHFNGRLAKKNTICGGSIINDRMILTAARCMISEPNIPTGKTIRPEDVDVVAKFHELGHFRIYDTDVKAVEQVIVHPEYAPARVRNYLDYDIAILVLKDKLVFPPLTDRLDYEPTQRLRPVCLPKVGEAIQLIGRQAMVERWRLLAPFREDDAAYTLRRLEVPINPLHNCSRIASAVISDRFICSVTYEKYRYLTESDYGGPLSILRDKQWTEVGIVSLAQPSLHDSTTTATFYTNVTSRDILPFVDYFAKRVGVDWCRSKL